MTSSVFISASLLPLLVNKYICCFFVAAAAWLAKVGSRLSGLVRSERGVDDARLVQPSCQHNPWWRLDGDRVEAVGADGEAEREEGLRYGP